MSLKNNLLETIVSALVLAEDAPQTIEVRAAIKQLKQAKGSISQMADFEETLVAAQDAAQGGAQDAEEDVDPPLKFEAKAQILKDLE